MSWVKNMNRCVGPASWDSNKQKGKSMKDKLMGLAQAYAEAYNHMTDIGDEGEAIAAFESEINELCAYLGDLPQAQADMLATIKAQRKVLELALEALQHNLKTLFAGDTYDMTTAAITAIQEQLK